MEKQKSTIIIFKRGNNYFADVDGCFGEVYSGAPAGDTPEAAGLFALREEGRYIKNNPAGGDLYATEEVWEAIKAIRNRV